VLAVVLAVLGAAVAPSAGASTGPAGRSLDLPPVSHPHDDELRINELQAVGTHNSYHLPPHPAFVAGLNAILPGVADFWLYEHRPLPEQFGDLGIRQIELDISADPEGGHYAERRAYEYAGLPRDPGIPELHEPGMKVFHVQEVDPESTCWTFVSCLTQLETWSDANPGHAPVMVLVEAKADTIPNMLGIEFQAPIAWTPELLDDVDAEIRSVFDEEDLLTPDDVRGTHDDLPAALAADGWPTMGEARGKVMFGLDNGGSLQSMYLDGHPVLEGRAMFTTGSPVGAPEAAVLKLNDPIGQAAQISAAVEAGYLVRTRADADSRPGVEDPDLFSTRDAALATGAQFVSTDFPEPDPAFDPDYEVVFDDGARVRCNPLVGPDWCETTDVEDPRLLEAPVPVCDPDAFPEVGATHPFCTEISWLVGNGLADGYADGTFRPTAPVSRQAVAAFLARSDDALPGPGEPCTSPFPDVPADHAFCHEIAWMVAQGITEGYPDGTFRPTEPVSRQAGAAFLVRATDPPTVPACAGTFADVPIGHAFCAEIDWLASIAVIGGYDDGTYRPTAPMSRQAAAAFLFRIASLA
jgi:hypothetical protein